MLTLFVIDNIDDMIHVVTVPFFNKDFEMIRNKSLYNIERQFIYFYNECSYDNLFSLNTYNFLPVFTILFSVLPTLTFSEVDVDTCSSNLFSILSLRSGGKTRDFTAVNKLFTTKIKDSFGEESVLNYLMLKYDILADNHGYYDSFYDSEMMCDLSKAFFIVNNKYFQFVMGMKKDEGCFVQFVVQTNLEVDCQFWNANYWEDYTLDEAFVSAQNGEEAFVCNVILPLPSQLSRTLSLKESAFLQLFLDLYLNRNVSVLADFVIAKAHTEVLFTKLSLYVYVNKLYYATKYFHGRLDEINCIFFTFIALSDMNLCNKGNVLNIIYYFYNLFLIYYVYGSIDVVDTRIFYDCISMEMDQIQTSLCFGSYMSHFDSGYNNFLEVRLLRLEEIFGSHMKTETNVSILNVDYFITDNFV